MEELIEQAKAELEPISNRLKGLYQLLMIFGEAHNITDAYLKTFDQIPIPIKTACSKSLVITYGKPWTRNYSTHLIDLDKTYLNEIEQQGIHSELLELRHTMVAHIDDNYEAYATVLSGPLALNTPQQEGTYPSLRVPIVVRMESTGVLWHINNKEKIKEISEHIERCANLTVAEIQLVAADFRKASLKHLPVIEQIPEIVSIRDFDSNGENNFDIKNIVDGTLSTNQINELEIGRINIQSMVTVREMQPESDMNYKGNGYEIKVTKTEENKMHFNVIFPKIQ